ncbi:hypothetical protein [Ralstonia pseudosolanacearum]|uniref:hypothetical protein n=1 Tax=Ralstonia pseudosolanacearum TaxID=1310165 RepID=UPI000AA8B206|nr:hypothetical protein [Ralstonia pseudosolanacearum]MDO3558425.1 hypothetical protein [Ralstonia pseudosolanacearum]MDO3577739.1 hypothetical protein [Ralstonia pseudosolanacearum]MDO3587063.1 hypothetical protein [Ralstonia pseudosolanacearum]
MTTETAIGGLPLKKGSGAKRQRRPFDPKRDLRKRLDRFLDHPTNPDALKSLVAGLVDYELNARLLRVLPPA